MRKCLNWGACLGLPSNYKAYANVQWHQRLFLPGYGKKHKGPQWCLNKEKYEWFIKIKTSGASFSFISHSYATALCTCPNVTQLGFRGSQAVPAPDLPGMCVLPLSCLLIWPENLEIQPQHIVICQSSKIDENNKRVSSKTILDGMFFSFAAYVLSYL